MGRQSGVPGQPGPVVVLDNGGGTCKLGIGGEAAPRSVFPNCIAKPKGERQAYIGNMLLDSKEISQLTLRRPFDRGYLVNMDLEKEIWGHAFKTVLGIGRPGSGLNYSDLGLCVTEPLFNFPALQAATEQVVFEEFRFQSFYAAPAPFFSIQRASIHTPDISAVKAGAGVVVDAGFSFMHAVPFFDWKPLMEGVKRVDVGGKLLTNYMKETVSFRCLNMMDEPYLMETIKDLVCFVSQDVRHDLKLASMRNSVHRREFVLPDGVSNLKGYLKPTAEELAAAAKDNADSAAQAGSAGGGATEEGAAGAGSTQQPPKQGGKPTGPTEQVLLLNNERFMVPEVMFHPHDIGLEQAGIAEAVMHAVNAIPPIVQGLAYNNVVLTGGLAACPGFKERFIKELQPLVPDSFALSVHAPPDPIVCAWEGMSSFVMRGQYHHCAMDRRQYEETGGSAAGAGRRF